MRFKWAILAAALALSRDVGGAGVGGPFTLANFDIPPPNNLNGPYGVFSPALNEEVCLAAEKVDEAVKCGKDGASLCLAYNVTRDGSFNGFWMKMGPERKERFYTFDASRFTQLTFWIKGDQETGIPRSLKIELKDEEGRKPGVQYVGRITREWQKISLPLRAYRQQGIDLTRLDEFVLVFEHRAAFPATRGTIWIDQIAFE
ncbi:MAG: hypothetical protein JXB04_12080 [Kiritimatiellae bacterium]|nr:hypothetical protein [Kiritimatiellia bacterium]